MAPRRFSRPKRWRSASSAAHSVTSASKSKSAPASMHCVDTTSTGAASGARSCPERTSGASSASSAVLSSGRILPVTRNTLVPAGSAWLARKRAATSRAVATRLTTTPTARPGMASFAAWVAQASTNAPCLAFSWPATFTSASVAGFFAASLRARISSARSFASRPKSPALPGVADICTNCHRSGNRARTSSSPRVHPRYRFTAASVCWKGTERCTSSSRSNTSLPSSPAWIGRIAGLTP